MYTRHSIQYQKTLNGISALLNSANLTLSGKIHAGLSLKSFNSSVETNVFKPGNSKKTDTFGLMTVSGQCGPSEFLDYVGLSHGDVIKKVYEMYGEPDEIDTTPHASNRARYLKNADNIVGLDFNFSKLDGRIKVITIGSPLAIDHIEKKLSDEKLHLYGVHRDVLIEKLGKPDRIGHGRYEYYYRKENARGMLSFVCYPHNDHICSYLSNFWFGT
ncbi:MAG: hypothetical protein QNJ78_09280 [Gammaproteobacteria bacterium]|nr:hypothetical protein [Gammaproteobacteria bacterium]